MCEVLKIRDVSLQFGVSARTLRYYEDMGLINSIRSQEYAYRLYDEKSISRLEQILVLRKLNISIKDIKMLFASSDSDTLLKILMKKVTDIDEEVSVLHEMKKLVIEFIEQVKKIDINNRENIVKIYDKLMRLEHQIEEVEITDFPVERLNQSKIISKVDVRIITLPPCKMVSSGLDKVGDFAEGGVLDKFDKWFSEVSQKRASIFTMPLDFLWYDKKQQGLVWWYVLYEEGIDTKDFDIIEYEGGMYAAAVSRDGDDEDGNRVHTAIKNWIMESGDFEIDEREEHYTMSHIISTDQIKEVLGYHQLEILVPIKSKQRN